MCLKLFSRYAERAHQGATVAGDHLRSTAVVVENAPKSLSRHDGASVIRACRQRCEELVAETLVVPFCVIVHYIFGYRGPQVSLIERYEAVETLSTYGGTNLSAYAFRFGLLAGTFKYFYRDDQERPGLDRRAHDQAFQLPLAKQA